MSQEKVSYFDRLAARCDKIGSSLCVGLDPDPKRIPRAVGKGPEAVYKFCAEVIEATADYAAAFKPNLAFFESIGIEGLHVLEQALRHVPGDVPVILDGKRGDIGSTARHYARAMFDRLGADAVTINPFMGIDSVEPFLRYTTKGCYILCLTSNSSARDFQFTGDLYLKIARKAAEWNERGNCGLVIGATRPQLLTIVASVAPGVPLLLPGLGAQGADLATLMAAIPPRPRHQMLINVSRSIIFAGEGDDFGRQARVAARYYFDRINQARDRHPAPAAGAEEQKV